jgi:hypothetical protein
VGQRTEKVQNEEQLGFTFFTDTVAEAETPSPGTPSPVKVSRAAKPRGFAETLAAVHVALLEAPLSEVNTQLLPLFEFCEAALTRALDVMPLRKDTLFSVEEYRSLRGVGQAQWLLAEAQGKRETKPAEGKKKKGRKTLNAESMNNE